MPGAYLNDIQNVPYAGDEMSAYALLGVTPGGHAESNQAKIVSNAYSILLGNRQADAAPIAPQAKRIKLYRAIKMASNNQWELHPREAMIAVPTHESFAPTTFSKDWKPSPGLLDLWFKGEAPWRQVRDLDVYESLRLLLQALDADGGETRKLNDLVSVGILLRHGVQRQPTQLGRWSV